MGKLESGGQVDRHHRVPQVTAELRHVSQQRDAGGVDQDVDRAQRLHAPPRAGGWDARLRDVGFFEYDPAPGGLDQSPGGPVILGQADREDVSAGLGQGHREGPAQAGVAAGDQGVTPGEREQVEAEVGDVHRSAAIRGGR